MEHSAMVEKFRTILFLADELRATGLDETQNQYVANLTQSASEALDQLDQVSKPQTDKLIYQSASSPSSVSSNPAPGLSKTGMCEMATHFEGKQAGLCGHVLVVEDNRVNQMLISTFLEKFGLTFEIAQNGQIAVEMANTKDFNVILMDVMMPVMDGLEATAKIRAFGGNKSAVPIIALTANAMSGDRETYLDAGMDAYVSKPLNSDDLFATLAKALGEKRADNQTVPARLAV